MMKIYEYLNYILTCIIVTYKFILYIIHKIAKKSCFNRCTNILGSNAKYLHLQKKNSYMTVVSTLYTG